MPTLAKVMPLPSGLALGLEKLELVEVLAVYRRRQCVTAQYQQERLCDCRLGRPQRHASIRRRRKAVNQVFGHGATCAWPQWFGRDAIAKAQTVVESFACRRLHGGHAYPCRRHSVTICAVGPLTIAQSSALAPEARWHQRKLSSWAAVISTGNVTPMAEFNFYVDPHAAQMVLQAVPRVLPLDVTHKHAHPAAHPRFGANGQ